MSVRFSQETALEWVCHESLDRYCRGFVPFWAALCRKLLHLGYRVKVKKSKKSESRYVHVKSKGKLCRVRVSLHRPGPGSVYDLTFDAADPKVTVNSAVVKVCNFLERGGRKQAQPRQARAP